VRTGQPGNLAPVQAARALYARFQVLIHELAKFGIVGAVCLVIDLSVFVSLNSGAHIGPLTSKVLSTIVSATCAYLGNRYWSFRHRARSGVRRELSLFLALNAVGLVIGLAVIAIAVYGFGVPRNGHGATAANLVGILLGTFFRFFSYKKFVFLQVEDPASLTQEERDDRAAEAILQV